MSDKKEHTPTPWQNIEWSCHAKTTIVIEDKDPPFGKTTVAEFVKEEDAAFAVEACNSHSRLVQENEELKKKIKVKHDALKGLAEYFAFMVKDPQFHEYVNAVKALET